MAAGEEFRIPTVTAEEEDLKTVRVVAIVPGFEVSKSLGIIGEAKPGKNCTVDPKYSSNSLEVTVVVKKKNKEEKFRYTVKKLPGEIVPEKCETKYKKEQVIMRLHKAEESSWAVQLSKRGLDQSEDE